MWIRHATTIINFAKQKTQKNPQSIFQQVLSEFYQKLKQEITSYL